jgi:hypothetical protein
MKSATADNREDLSENSENRRLMVNICKLLAFVFLLLSDEQEPVSNDAAITNTRTMR